jgi:hypothetical protein
MKHGGQIGSEVRADKGLSNGQFAIMLLGLFSLVGVATVGALVRVTRSESEVEARALIRASGPLCAAIDAYAVQSGRSPESLETLVPDFVTELPPLEVSSDTGFRYQGGETGAWRLSIWGGHYMYERTSVEEPWFVTGDADVSYPVSGWRPFE